MSDRPISFSPAMAHALLREINNPGMGKTQTRRLTAQPPFEAEGCHQAELGGRNIWWDFWASDRAEVVRFKLPITIGDRPDMREHWRIRGEVGDHAPRDLPPRSVAVFFEDGGSLVEWPDCLPCDEPAQPPEWAGRPRQGMHMPKWASRITLLVTDVRVHRLHDISDSDAIA